MKRAVSILATVALLIGLAGCGQPNAADILASYPDARVINLSGNRATLDGEAVEVFDYTWHCDPSVSHDEVKNAPAEYYTGEKPQTDAAAYIDQELYYFPALDESGFTLQNYDGEKEWTYYYTDGEHNEYIFATLPALGNSLPIQMMHTAEEAAANKVLHIQKPGTYALSGEWDGQIWIDLGDEDDTFTDENAKVTVLLNGVDITCTVAPAVVFRSGYECDNAWEEQTAWSDDVDTTDAGVNVVLAGTNSVSGTNIYRMLKTVYKDDDSTDAVKVQKKLRKIDAAFYSYISMNIGGEGALTVTSGFEGLDSELHLSINGGNITINSQDDGINVNEDNVSVVAINGGNITINAAQGVEGDGIDSNGFITVNGGTLTINGITPPDSAMDSEDGIRYTAGTVLIDGQEQSYTAGAVFRETGGMGGGGDFGNRPNMPEMTSFDLADFKEQVAALDDDATLEDVLALLGMGAFGGERPDGMQQPPENRQPPQ